MFFVNKKPSNRMEDIINIIQSNKYNKEDYVKKVKYDYEKAINNSFKISRPTKKSIYPKDKLYPRIENFNVFGARAIKTNKEISLNLNMGTFYALNDIFFRLASCEDFFTFDSQKKGQRQWKGSDCLWFHMVGEYLPEYRFYDYNLVAKKPIEKCKSTFLSGYYEAFPGDNERENMAILMIEVAITWILLHEEGHYIGGHINYIYDKHNMTSIDEIKDFEEYIIPTEINKIFEWQADRTATSAIFDIFFQNYYLDFIPSYCGNKFIWLFRLLLVSIGTVIQIIQKSRLIQEEVKSFSNNIENAYPSTRTRLLASTHIALDNFRVKKYNDAYKGKSQENLSIFMSSIHGALDDLNIVACLINKDGENASWQLGESPKIEESRIQGLIDTPKEVTMLSSLIELSLLPDDYRNKVFLNPDLRKYKILYYEWFSELENIVLQYDQKVAPFMRKYRHEVGNFT